MYGVNAAQGAMMQSESLPLNSGIAVLTPSQARNSRTIREILLRSLLSLQRNTRRDESTAGGLGGVRCVGKRGIN